MTAVSKRVMFTPDGGAPVVGTLVELPPTIWGPTDPRPGWGLPGDQPGIWPNPPEGQAPIVSHPIVLPGDPSWEPPVPIDPPPGTEPPDAPPQNCKWVYTAAGWMLMCGPYDKPRPPGK